MSNNGRPGRDSGSPCPHGRLSHWPAFIYFIFGGGKGSFEIEFLCIALVGLKLVL